MGLMVWLLRASRGNKAAVIWAALLIVFAVRMVVVPHTPLKDFLPFLLR